MPQLKKINVDFSMETGTEFSKKASYIVMSL